MKTPRLEVFIKSPWPIGGQACMAALCETETLGTGRKPVWPCSTGDCWQWVQDPCLGCGYQRRDKAPRQTGLCSLLPLGLTVAVCSWECFYLPALSSPDFPSSHVVRRRMFRCKAGNPAELLERHHPQRVLLNFKIAMREIKSMIIQLKQALLTTDQEDGHWPGPDPVLPGNGVELA